MKKTNKDFTYAVGKRRTATARIRLHKGKGDHTVNGKPALEYFAGLVNAGLWSRPFVMTETEGKYYVTVKVSGGGKKGQFDATLHGIAKALSDLNAESNQVLKKSGYLTRDSRIRERRKVGTGGKARRKKQSPKR